MSSTSFVFKIDGPQNSISLYETDFEGIWGNHYFPHIESSFQDHFLAGNK